jgi:hypothetical protein
MFIGHSNCIQQVSFEIRSKYSIANPRLPKCHECHILEPKINLQEHNLGFHRA